MTLTFLFILLLYLFKGLKRFHVPCLISSVETHKTIYWFLSNFGKMWGTKKSHATVMLYFLTRTVKLKCAVVIGLLKNKTCCRAERSSCRVTLF